MLFFIFLSKSLGLLAGDDKVVCTELATLMQFRCGSTNYKVAN